MKKLLLGKGLYGHKWHILREDGRPACGYTSFNWKDIEEKKVSIQEIENLELCSNCRKIVVRLNGKGKRKKRSKEKNSFQE